MDILYADVIIDITHEKLDKPFQYRVPDALRDQLQVGMCVMIPFGNGNRMIKGYCVGLGTQCKFDPEKTKDIISIVPGNTGGESRSIELAAWIRQNYGSTMIQALKTVLPMRKSVKKLEFKFVERLADREELIALLGECRRKHQPAKARLTEALLEQERIPYEWITGKLNVSAQTIQSMERNGVLRIQKRDSYRNPVKIDFCEEQRKTLSEGQRKIVDTILREYEEGVRCVYLIHGITGSGKTEIYIRLAQDMVNRGLQTIVLIPEIALTYQTLIRFYRHFGDRVTVMNSTLSAGEKYDQCQRAAKGEIDVIIGPRSALFTPFEHLGLIIMDEEHEGSYKSETTPKYHTRETAEKLASLTGASLVLGSATPSLESYYKAQKGEYKLFELTNRMSGSNLAETEIVDLRKELREGNRSIFSRRLQNLLEDRLKKGQQSILFLNRRGYSGFVSCRNCGTVMKCPHCDVALSEHRGGRMICHYCGYSTIKPAICTECGSKYLLGFRAGTQQIEEKLKELFPGIRTLRMDRDTTKTKDSYEKILSAFASHEADVLIGTQMIVKGHDFPGVTLVGVLAADLSLGEGDYRSGERTFQLLTQAVGRAGRGEIPGIAVIQTYQPEHYAIVYASKQDYPGFYQEEILYREIGGYPPVSHLLAVQVFSQDAQRGEQLASYLKTKILKMLNDPGCTTEKLTYKSTDKESARTKCSLLGPTPATIGKISDIYRHVLYVKTISYDLLIEVKDYLEPIIEKLGLRSENVQFDFDPVHIL